MLTEYITLGVYLAVLLALGAYFKKFTNNLSDFVRGGAQGRWWLIGTSILMSAISAFTFTGNASAAFEGGPSLLVIYIANCAGFACGGLFLGRWMRQTRAYTSADVVRKRFGVPVEQFNAYFGVVMYPITAAIQLYALSLFASTVLGLPLIPILITIAIIVTFYSTSGGKWAVMATDFVQAMVMISITLLVCFLSLRAIGGFSEFFSYFKDPRFAEDFKFIKDAGTFDGDRYTLKWAIVIFFIQVNAQISLSSAGRYITARDGKEAAKASWLGFALMAIGSAVWFIPPMIARFLFEAEILGSGIDKPAESAYAYIAMELLPNGLLGMMIAAMFAATMSSMDTGLNSQVGMIARNIIPRIRTMLGREHALSPKQEMRICHIATVCLGILITLYAMFFVFYDEVTLFDVSLMIAAVIGVPLSFPLFLGLWLRKLPKWSFFPIFAACTIPSLYTFIDSKFFGNPWTVQDKAMWIMTFGIAAGLICRLLAKHSSQQSTVELEAFFEEMDRPINYQEEIGESAIDYEQYFIIAKALFFVGALITLILLLPNDFFNRLCVLFIAGFVFTIGALLWWGGTRAKAIVQKNQSTQKQAVADNEAATLKP
ncbi:hypothetical protein SH580_05185 [Coraliomargarita algicola]|uniref:Na+/solute symporter n=1 Tax=Coraliomargarita algicola TaxID=3092156 RepID=A0ABZ0RVU5_9BACT|nr:hypothetical protein [Coraliomargarita sp. J2-16]WPJ97099.1 hypothetical protein SH580_05185 [Coraliomargarita sp. J2-16]